MADYEGRRRNRDNENEWRQRNDEYNRDYGRSYGDSEQSGRRYGSDSGRSGSGYDQGYTYGRGYGRTGAGDTGSSDRGRYYGTDWTSPGRYSGRGPEGYRRSDERIREDINDRLTWHGDIDARKIQVSVNNGEVTLEGSVGERRQKRMAEDVAEDVWGVKDIHNRLSVDQSLLEQIGEGISNLTGGNDQNQGRNNR